MIRYLSVCSGVEAASVAWHPLGWQAVGFSEIESFPAAVLAHRFPDTPNFGDLTKHETWNLAPGSVDLLVGGTPCQAFSVAGKRAGLDDPRGQLMLAYLDLAGRLRPRWIVWENVPGVLSSNGGRDFGALLGGLEHLGYGWAYRVLDAQWVRTQRHPRAVPQRRRRVFVVGCLGDAASAAAVLFERESVQRNPAKGRAKGQGAAADAGGGAASRGGREWPAVIWREGDQANASHCEDFAGTLNCDKGQQGGIIVQPVNPEVAPTLDASYHKGPGMRAGQERIVIAQPVNPEVAQAVAHALTRRHDSSEDGTGRGVPIVIDRAAFNQGKNAQYAPMIQASETMPALVAKGPHAVAHETIAFKPGQSSAARSLGAQVEVACTLEAGGGGNNRQAIAFHPTQDPTVSVSDVAFCLAANAQSKVQAVAATLAVRRLTPRECERLQGFPDDWTAIAYRGKPAADGPRYKAMGNSMAVNCMAWIGERIAAVNARIGKDAGGAP